MWPEKAVALVLGEEKQQPRSTFQIENWSEKGSKQNDWTM